MPWKYQHNIFYETYGYNKHTSSPVEPQETHTTGEKAANKMEQEGVGVWKHWKESISNITLQTWRLLLLITNVTLFKSVVILVLLFEF